MMNIYKPMLHSINKRAARNLLGLLCCFFCTGAFAEKADTVFQLASPDTQLVYQVKVAKQSSLLYRVVYRKKEIIRWSPLGLVLESESLPGNEVTVRHVMRSAKNEMIPWLFGENDSIRNNYREMKLDVAQPNGRSFNIVARIFKGSIAFRYEIPATLDRKGYRIINETTGFNFTGSYLAYQHTTESVISPVTIPELKKSSDFPLVLASPGLFVSINEARNNAYTKAVITKSATTDNGVRIHFLKDTVQTDHGFVSPWRTISIATTATGLCDNSALLYQLNDPPPSGLKTDWIKPGKLIREMTLTTAGAIACIDFAAKMNLQYIMFDAGWYGKGYAAEHSPDSDPLKVVPEIDLPRVVSYGKQKNIGLIVYVNYVGLRKNNLDTLFTLYRNWGIKGLKFGFVDGLSQHGILWLMQAVKKATDYGFIVDVHDNYKPTGISRTIPGWLTQEGVRGNENNPDAFHNTTLPFTRFLSGAADYTFCYRNQNDSFNNTLLSKKLQVSQAQQLALTVIFYSPLQSVFWYGRPADYRNAQDIEFFKYVPTVWNKTIHLKGAIGKYVVTARKSGEDWFIGAAAGAEAYQTELSLDFLSKGKTYTAYMYTDDGQGGIAKTERTVNRYSTIKVNIAGRGGEAVRIVPSDNRQ
jgi:alpha-glucosidase